MFAFGAAERQDRSRPSTREQIGDTRKVRLAISDTTYLRPLEQSDAEELHELIDANRERLARWLPWAAAQTREQTIAFIRQTKAQADHNSGFQTAIVCDGAIAGVVGFVGVDWQHRTTTLGYWLGAAYEGEGTMTEAVRVLVDHALSVWELNRVEIRAAVENRRSRAIPERLGFREEGRLREAELVDGRYLDLVVYSMLAKDWNGLNRARRG